MSVSTLVRIQLKTGQEHFIDRQTLITASPYFAAALDGKWSKIDPDTDTLHLCHESNNDLFTQLLYYIKTGKITKTTLQNEILLDAFTLFASYYMIDIQELPTNFYISKTVWILEESIREVIKDRNLMKNENTGDFSLNITEDDWIVFYKLFFCKSVSFISCLYIKDDSYISDDWEPCTDNYYLMVHSTKTIQEMEELVPGFACFFEELQLSKH